MSSSKDSAYSAMCSPLIRSSAGKTKSPWGISKPASTAPLRAAKILEPLIGDFKPISKIALSIPLAKALLAQR